MPPLHHTIMLRSATSADVSTLRYIEPNLRAIDIWVGEAKNLNRGLSTGMMRLALERCFADKNVTAVLIDPLESNVDAIRFYKRLGFEFVQNRRFDGDDCRVYQMTREQWLGK